MKMIHVDLVRPALAARTVPDLVVLAGIANEWDLTEPPKGAHTDAR